MYEVDDAVLYGLNGVCRVVEITTQTFGKSKSKYYVLKPVFTDSFEIFVPVENQNLTQRMRRVDSRENLMGMIAMFSINPIWIADDNTRISSYNETLKNADNSELIAMVSALCERRKELKNNKKKLNSTDEKFLKDGSRLISEEFAYVPEIDQGDVKQMIAERTGIAI